MMELSSDDINVLCEALEAWEQKDTMTDLMADMIGAMFTKGDPESKAKAEAERIKAEAERNMRATARKKRSVVLRAKLLQWGAEKDIARLQESVR